MILALHGNDYRAAFDLFGHYAADRGVLVEGYDQPGFYVPGPDRGAGGAPGRHRWLPLDDAISALRARHQAMPVFVLGESMGAAVAVMALARPRAPPWLASSSPHPRSGAATACPKPHGLADHRPCRPCG
ncbi:MAG: alpha/beta hydrolase [Geminicoccaceae bacterium]